MTKTTAFALILALLCSRALAQGSNFTADTLVPACRAFLAAETPTTAQALREGLCVGIVATVYADGSIYNNANRFCVPSNSSTKQAIQIIVRFFDEHPDVRRADLRDIAIVAFKQSWPCEVN